MSNLMYIRHKLLSGMQAGALALVLTICGVASAQNAVSPGAQTGTIQQAAVDDGYITISGTNYTFSLEVTKLTLEGEPVRATFLLEGMVVRFTLNREKVLDRVEILGPATLVNSMRQPS